MFNFNTADARLSNLNREGELLLIWTPNVVGCIAFMISACFAFVPEHAPSFDAVEISIIFTLIGAICFWLGSFLMWPESIVAHAD
ncbi:MAG: spore maturation protein SpmA [Lentimonas sp.]|jgi:spore maturation protein SpmA